MLKIKDLRLDLGFTQKEFAEKLGLDAHNIGDWERGKGEPSSFWLIKIANTFNVSIDYLLGIEDDFGNYVTPANTFSDLSSEELAIIKKLRALDPRHRELVKSQIETLAELSSQKTK